MTHQRAEPGDHLGLAVGIKTGRGLIEDEDPSSGDLVRAIFDRTGRAYLVGVTGPPGAGKSTLVDRLTFELRKTGVTLGVIAVDPTSPFSGGAVLGDRLRMQAHAQDEGVFIRSMATRGHLGGLARATGDAALVLDAAGKDIIIIETVGVGQDEVDIIRTADVSIVTLVPGTGDEVQALKAGIKIAFGTDIGGIPWTDPIAQEFDYMVKFGMTPMDAIKAATSKAAELLERQGELGVIAPGAYADIIAVKGDPIADVGALKTVEFVMKDGKVFKKQ